MTADVAPGSRWKLATGRSGEARRARRDAVFAAVSAVVEPQTSMTVAELDLLEDVEMSSRGAITVTLRVLVRDAQENAALVGAVRTAVQTAEPGCDVRVEETMLDERRRVGVGHRLRSRAEASRLGSQRQVYAIASGKGGVGKSTVTANLAVALAQQGRRVGILDADVWGYSVPRLMGVRRAPVAVAGMMLPVTAHGVQLMSVGFFVQDDEPVLWRGPMLHKAIEQFSQDVAWVELDVLLVDLPPGTGDVQMSLLEQLPEAAFVVVTTPQAAAVDVAARVGRMALDARLPIAGVVENMTAVACGCCGAANDVFGSDGGVDLAARLGSQVLGSIPLDAATRIAGDAGTPVVLSGPESPAAQVFSRIAVDLPVVKRSLLGRSLPLSVV